MLGRQRRWAFDGADLEAGTGLDEFSHGFGETGEVRGIHGVGFFGGGVVRGDEADVGQRGDGEELEGGLGFLELDVAKEKGGRGGIVEGEGGREEAELGAKLGQMEFGLVSKLGSIEEDKEGEGAGGGS